MTNPCIGLFGTCDNVPWRESFITQYNSQGIDFFNPDTGNDWHPGLIEEENKHLQEDGIILFPILGASLGLGSLGEIGFSVSNVLRMVLSGGNRYLITLIDDECVDARKTEGERKESNRTRRLVKSKLMEYKNHPNIYIVDNLDEMLSTSLTCYFIFTQIQSLKTA